MEDGRVIGMLWKIGKAGKMDTWTASEPAVNPHIGG